MSLCFAAFFDTVNYEFIGYYTKIRYFSIFFQFQSYCLFVILFFFLGGGETQQAHRRAYTVINHAFHFFFSLFFLFYPFHTHSHSHSLQQFYKFFKFDTFCLLVICVQVVLYFKLCQLLHKAFIWFNIPFS